MNIFVGKLSWGTTSDQLQELFEDYGTVDSAKVITDRDSGRSRGFGFVEMPVKEEGEEAIEALDGSNFDGRDIAVSEARERSDNRGGGGGGGGGGRGGYGGGGGGGGRGRY